MINLLNFLKESSRANNLISNVSELNGHQGTVVRFSDDFLVLFNIWKSSPKYLQYFLEYYADFYGFRPFDSSFMSNEFIRKLGYVGQLSTYTSNIDFYEWENFYNQVLRIYPEEFIRIYFKPLELIICIFNDTNPVEFDKAIKEFNEHDIEKSKFPEFRVILEKRGRNTFLSGSKKNHPKMIGGISISNNSQKYGTLGGVLTDKNGKHYGLTCAHVANELKEEVFQPAISDSKDYRRFGQVEFSSPINWSSPDSPCNPRNVSGLGMDASLISSDSNILTEKRIHNLGRINGEKKLNEIHQHMEVEFNGRTTNHRKKLVVGGICVSYKVVYEGEEGDQFACFTNLIELRTQHPLLSFGSYNAQSSPVKQGDSGSWICSNDKNGYNWCGMLISGDLDRGYFLAAEDVQQYLKSNNYDLDCSN